MPLFRDETEREGGDVARERLRVLFVSREFPSEKEPHQATFNSQQVQALSRICEVMVVSPRPWFPFLRRRPYRPLLPLCEREFRNGLEVVYPKFLNIPLVGRRLQVGLLAFALGRVLRIIRGRFRFDVVYANPLLPDALAAAVAVRRWGIPVVGAALGTDVNRNIRSGGGRRRLREVLRHLDAVVAVSQDLAGKLDSLSASAPATVIYDGVDRSRFFPREKSACRKALGLPDRGKLILFAGNLLAAKGVGVLLDALDRVECDGLTAVFVGDGPMERDVQRSAHLTGRCTVVCPGPRPHDEIPVWMGACDLLCLPSFSEGVPNVVLEAMACGRPVVASRVGGIPEVVREGVTGILVPPGDSAMVASAIEEALGAKWDERTISSCAERFSWDENGRMLATILCDAARRRSRRKGIVALSKEWAGDWTSNHHVMAELARTRKVLWVNSIGMRSPDVRSGGDLRRMVRKLTEHVCGARRVSPNLFVFTPLAWPFSSPAVLKRAGEAYLRWSIRFQARRAGIGRFDLWTFLPNTGNLIGRLGEDRSVYYCTDLFRGFAYLDGEMIQQKEEDVVARADLVIVTSRYLFDEKKTMNPRTLLVRHGVSRIFFVDRAQTSFCDPALEGLGRPVLGFYGWIRDTVDQDLLEQVARAFPQATVLLIGKVSVDVDRLRTYPNIMFLGQKPYHLLPAYAAQFDVGLIPYRMNPELMEATNPVKLKEYLALGLPVVSTDLAEVREYADVCWVAATPDEFIEGIRQALGPEGARRGKTGRERVEAETWERKVEEICRIMEDSRW